jgi:prephenate dehydratase
MMLKTPVSTVVGDKGSRRLIFSLHDRPGALTGALDLLKKHGLNMSHIESRPSITADHVYDFFVALSPESASIEAIQALVNEVKSSGAGDISLLSEASTGDNDSTFILILGLP